MKSKTASKCLLFSVKLLHGVEMPNDVEIETTLTRNTINLEQCPKVLNFVNKVKFKFWTLSPNSELIGTPIQLHDKSAIKTIWFPNKPLKVIIHGWLSTAENRKGVFLVTKAYAEKNGEFNVISVDWSLISNKKNYVAVAKTCNEVGAIVAQLLMNLEDLSLVVPAMLHVIGHSLGAHVAGAVGQVHVRMKKSKIARISGLDPPAPAFIRHSWIFWAEHDRLDRGDAEFVDVIKTTTLPIGIDLHVGHADFHPNNSDPHLQGCYKKYPFYEWICSHNRAYKYYTESVQNSCGTFESVKCSSMKDFMKGVCKGSKRSHMGHFADPSVHGDFYLTTNGTIPYSTALPTWKNDDEESQLTI